MNTLLILQNGLLYGLLLSILLGLTILISFSINPEIWVGDYPPDIKARFTPVRSDTKRHKRLASLAFLIFLVGVIALSILQLDRLLGSLTFWVVFLSAFITLLVFNTFDLLVLDWLIFNTLQPKMIILPGTQGMAGYKDYAFHFRGFLIGLVFCLVGALVSAGIAMLVYLLMPS
jgi:hypothetical protein